ncbi:bone morphogenetic protein receptor type-2-like isoform X2 [Cheilinus undulatus]|uniref:bone morphogenetic protein receptor type-2-like isoform X2 n=1 Tax=Cheilinus undulatus TaxID=241271 RepID=UPI001BD499AB|nr:bone morphogenetic protein receptor type-2-like isoform X2 [Cheilinus undulatus]
MDADNIPGQWKIIIWIHFFISTAHYMAGDSICWTCRCVAVGVMPGNVGNSSHVPRTDKFSACPVLAQSDHDDHATVAANLSSGQSFLQKRQCAFQVSPQNSNYTAAGNVSGSVQLCESTQCCVGYFLIIDGQPTVDLLACDVAEKSCPDEVCKAQTRFGGRLIKCVCNTDLCNSNITWIPESDETHPTLSYSSDGTMKIVVILAVTMALCFMVVFAKRGFFKEKKENTPSLDDYTFTKLCSCQTVKTSETDISDIKLQQIVSHGHFATVWKGRHQGCVVAVKVYPAGWKDKWSAEKEVYELPLMNHAGIVPFLGAGRKTDGSWLMVLQFAEYHTTSWTSSLNLCQSLSQGLSYLHSDLHKHDMHKPPVAHRDLSSFNVLVRADGTCVLCDFGCSTILRSCSGQRHLHNRMSIMERQLGTLCYMSPEVLEGSVNLRNTWCLLQGDIYALGLLLWEIWMRCSDLFQGTIVPQRLLPYQSELGVKVTLENLIVHVCYMDQRPSIPKHWKLLPQGSALQELFEDCWDCDPDARLTAQCVAERIDRLASFQSDYSQ